MNLSGRLLLRSRALVALAVLAVLGSSVLAGTANADETAQGTPDGASVQVSENGGYSVTFASPGYEFAGSVGHPVSGITNTSGDDGVGSFTEIDFRSTTGAARTYSIKAYRHTSVVVLGTTYADGGANTEPFPAFSRYPALPHKQTYSGCFGNSQFDTTAGAADSPWLFFDDAADGFMISPASHFSVARTWQVNDGTLASGIDPAITTVPAKTTQQTVLVAGKGIGDIYSTWGKALTDLQGKQRPANDADVTLDKLGYWTDNGATYYYKYDQNLGYAGTLQAVKKDWDAKGIPMGYLQLDSWFYPKGPNAQWNDNPEGEYRYEAAKDLFPNDLGGLRKDLGNIPLVTHARWIDPSSPYHSEYKMSGNVVTDPAFWDDRSAYLAKNGVAAYEQDWLCSHAQPAYNMTDRDAFEDNMARATAANGLTMQYCMPEPRDFLQESKYSNLTTTRVSDDRFERGKWDAALYTSQLAGAVGAWPWVDVFMSTETRNLVLATLSAGPVGVGDAVGAESRTNLLQVARPDGVIVKPDVPLVPTDATYVAQASGKQPAMVAATHSDHGSVRDGYVYAYARNIDLPTPDTIYQAEDAQLNGPVVGSDHTGYTGRGFADYQHDSGDSVTWNVQAPSDGTYTLLFRYANGGTGNRPLDVAVNGSDAGAQPFEPTGSWDSWLDQTVTVDLHAGSNTVKATATGASGGNIDYLGVSKGVVQVPNTQDTSFTPASVGVQGDAYVYDYFAGTGQTVPSGQAYSTSVDKNGSYYLVAPVNRAGIAFLGDAGKFASLGQKRITRLSQDGDAVVATAAFARGEGAVTMHGHANGPVTVDGDGVRGVHYDASTGMFTFQVQPVDGASTAAFTILSAS
ncbi:MAG: carbohydrate-binding protein [Streptosporangiales bacterium]|nr:carbohydrate-binding protein [Streptosporangiales bacterium]